MQQLFQLGKVDQQQWDERVASQKYALGRRYSALRLARRWLIDKSPQISCRCNWGQATAQESNCLEWIGEQLAWSFLLLYECPWKMGRIVQCGHPEKFTTAQILLDSIGQEKRWQNNAHSTPILKQNCVSLFTGPKWHSSEGKWQKAHKKSRLFPFNHTKSKRDLKIFCPN